MAKIQRHTLRDLVTDELAERLLTGTLEPGSSLNELELAEEMGVSRTPLRAALHRLQFEGFVEHRPGKGFSVRPLDKKTAGELCLLAGTLEGLAMQLIDVYDPGCIRRLRALDEKRKQAIDQPEKNVRIDREWHDELVSDCGNVQLQWVLELVKNRLYWYARKYMQKRRRIAEAIDQHEQLIALLEEDEIEVAQKAILRHWMTIFHGAAAHEDGGGNSASDPGVADSPPLQEEGP